MNWLIKTLAGAFVAGVGLKLGGEVYDTVKKQLQGLARTEGAAAGEPAKAQKEPAAADAEAPPLEGILEDIGDGEQSLG